MEEKEIKCPWCEDTMTPIVRQDSGKFGNINERRCSKCDKILGAYLVEEGDFFPKIKRFANK
ncbi:MAG: hypothetical protein HQ552_00030 [Desulfobacteraceae bacterium]|nr:hypothetical protein [Desulfobacteraceae bacterium]